MAKGGPRALAYSDRTAAGEGGLATKLQGDHAEGIFGPLEALLAHGPPAFIASTSGELLFANSAYAELARSVGSGRRGLPGEPALAPNEMLTRAYQSAGVVEETQQLQGADGPLLIRARCWALPGDEAVAGIYEDRGEEMAALHKARQAKARFDDIARLTSDWVWELDQEFKFTFASTRVADIIGVPARLLIGRSLFDCGQFEGFPEANRFDHPYPDSRTPFKNVVYRIVGVDDCPRLFALSGVPIFEDVTGRFLGYRGTATDISVQAEAESRITEAQTRLIHALETMPQGFAVYDSEDRVVLCNSRYEEFLAPDGSMIEPGIPYETLLRGVAERGLFPGSPAEVETFIMEQVVRHGMATRELEIQLADGRWVQIASEMTEDSGIIEVWSDISRIKKREAELRKAEEIARRAHQQSELANRAKSEFLATMSHELRTPLNAVLGYAELILDEIYGPVPDGLRNVIERIDHNGHHLLRLINDVLDLSKIEAGQLALHLDDYSLRDVVDNVLASLESLAQEKGLDLVREIQGNLPVGRGDEQRITQVLMNLVGNAIKFTDLGEVTVKAGAANGTFRISVKDTGVGISEADQRRIFEEFHQADDSDTRSQGGTGLGLAIAKRMVQMHGGDIWAESRLGEGTTISFSLPVRVEAQKGAA